MSSPALDKVPTFFIDRNSGGRKLRERLKHAGVDFVLHDDIFSTTTTDLEWLQGVATRGYVVITGDRDCTHRFLFLEALSKSTVYVFVLYDLNGASADEKARQILAVGPTIVRILAEQVPPAIWRLSNSVAPRRIDHEQILARMYKSKRRP